MTSLALKLGDRSFAHTGRLVFMLLLSASLASCAGHFAYLEGQKLINDNQPEAGMAKLEQAINDNPKSGEYRRALTLARERSAETLLRQADARVRAGKYSEAMVFYRQVLAIQPANPLAAQGLTDLDLRERLRSLLTSAREMLQAKEWVQARTTLAAALRLDPGNAQAIDMQNEVTQHLLQPLQDDTLQDTFKKPVSIEFSDVPIRQAFDVLGKSAGLNFVFDKDIKTDQKVSIVLRNSTVDLALHLMLQANQLQRQVVNSNTLLIFPNTQAKLKDYQELNVRSFHMAFADAKSVANTLKTLYKGREVVVDEKLNMLVVRDTPEMLKQIERIVALHDVSEPEVMLEVEILEVSRDKLLALGITWPGGIGLTPLASDATVGLTLQDLRATNAATQLVTLPSGSTWPVINAKATDSDVKTLANPKIRVVNREKAKVMIGDRLPVVTTTTSAASNFAAQSVTYLDVGLKLDVEPVIYRGDEISIKVGLEVSSVTGSVDLTGGGKAYSLGTRNASTVLRLRNGENQVLAGLISDEERNSANKVPGLGDLPLLGLLFGSKEDKNNRKEIILSITPKLVRRVVRPDEQLLEFRSGTEGNSRERPAASEVTTTSATPATPATPAVPAVPAAPVSPTPPAPPAPSASPAASVNPASAASMSTPTAQSAVPTVTPSTPAGENAK